MTISWICGPDMLDHAPEIPIVRAHYQICANRGPGNMRCDRPQGHGGRCYESIWDSSTDGTEIRFVIGVWNND